ncbi:hypothetical protein FXO38_16986 [Capsicum annuum]|nr:hypothetical protein FXO38_16986 [Capsicum annuum]
MVKDGYAYEMQPLIYDSKFKSEEETTQAMAWISFTDLLPTFFGKKTLFSTANIVGKPIHLDNATINKIRPSCARVKIQVDLATNLPSNVEIEVVNSRNDSARIVTISVHYDHLPKYYKNAISKGIQKRTVECFTQN